MFCKKCGSEINEGAAFCPKCGTRVEVHVSEFGREPVFRLETRVNGELVQCCTTELRKFTPEWVVSDVSRLSLLKAASIFWTGTPFGCGKDQDPPRWLRKGDVVECTVEGLGTLTNTVV